MGWLGKVTGVVIGKLSVQSTSTERIAHGAFKKKLHVYSAPGSIAARMLAPTLQLSNALIKRKTVTNALMIQLQQPSASAGVEGERGDIDLHSDTAPTHVQFE